MNFKNKGTVSLSCCVTLLFLICCVKEQKRNNVAIQPERFQELTDRLTLLEKNDDLKNFLQNYDTNAISMPEYQLTLTGIKELEAYYKAIFQRQNVRTFQKKPTEIIDLGNTIVEIGIFKKEYFDSSSTDTIVTQTGKYWNVWNTRNEGAFKIKAEAFGYFHPIKNPEALILQLHKKQPDESEILLRKKIPFELKAYNSLMEKGVRNRDGDLRSQFFTNDGSFMPFADTTVSGMQEIKPYLTAYSNRGTVTIDSIMCYTYDFENSGDYILEYDMFKVKWSVPGFSGRTEGKGIRIWKRQEDHSLKLYREIGTHNHL
jgi:ketosteroid isomerase-like protein